MEENKDFSVTYATDLPLENTVILTTAEMSEKWLSEAMQRYDPTNRQYSTILNDKSSQNVVTMDLLNQLARNPQGDLNKIKQINSIVKYYINSNDIIGKVADVVETNVNTKYRLSYKDYSSQRNKLKTLGRAKSIINSFNDAICLESIIRTSIPTVYTEGTYIMYLRHNNGDYKIDFFPLGVAIISDYSIGNEPCVLIDIQELQSRLSNNYPKTKKRKPLFFKDMKEEIEANYPAEVYEAYKNKEQYAKLDIRYSYVMRVGNMGGKYGLTPIFRALPDALMLNTFRETDEITAKSRGKKIIAQLLNKEMAGSDYDKDCFPIVSWSHENFVQAFSQKTVLVTGHPAVRDIKYVESKMELTDVRVVNEYKNKLMTTLGISFSMSDSSGSVSTANIAVSQLLKTINKISSQLEIGINKFYKQILTDNGIGLEYCPKISIIDSEQLEMDVKKDLASLLYTTFNISLETCLQLLGFDVNDEIVKRKEENAAGFDEIFAPRLTSFTSSGNNDKDKGGNPREAKNKEKEAYDDEYNKNAR